MIPLALVINILVLATLCLALIREQPAMDAAYGPDTPARGILIAMYLTILGLSVLALVAPLPLAAVQTLVAFQVIYKLTTALTVGLSNPVVRANLAIAAFHAVALATSL